MSPLDLLSNININIDFYSIISYLVSADLQNRLFAVRIAFTAIIIALLGVVIFLASKTHYLEWLFLQDVVQFVTMRPFGAKKITGQWNKITRRLEAGTEAEQKLAVIEADDMLDASLKRLGYAGQTLEEKLEKLTSATLPNMEQIHESRRLRNNIVHDPDYRLSSEEAKKALDVYAKAFRDLQILGD